MTQSAASRIAGSVSEPSVIIITGPTASGKSALAVDVAEHLGTEIISADSRQIYQGIPIVTAMPGQEERARVRHHLIDMLPLERSYSAAEFETDSIRIIRRLLEEKGSAVVCGGSMMYVDALCHGIDQLPTVPDEIRSGLKEELDSKGNIWLLDELLRLDPEYYGIVDRNNIKRVFHAVEIIRTAGCTYTSLRTGIKKERDFKIIRYCVNRERPELFDRINKRVDAMVSAGLEQEARSVYAMRHLNSLNTVGLKEMFAMFDGTFDRDTAISRIKKNTRVYAKKQLTWWKRDPDIIPLNLSGEP